MEKPINAAIRNKAMGKFSFASIILIVILGLHALIFSSVWKIEQQNQKELTIRK
jgi:hypothetical protein